MEMAGKKEMTDHREEKEEEEMRQRLKNEREQSTEEKTTESSGPARMRWTANAMLIA